MLGLSTLEWRIVLIYSAIVVSIWISYLLVFRAWIGVDFMRWKILEIPMQLKCYGRKPDASREGCAAGDFDVYSIAHALIYLGIGAIIPHRYGVVLAISVAFEAYELLAGWRARWWQDPLANLAGYAIGSALSKTSFAKKMRRRALDTASSNAVVLASGIALALALASTGYARRAAAKIHELD